MPQRMDRIAVAGPDRRSLPTDRLVCLFVCLFVCVCAQARRRLVSAHFFGAVVPALFGADVGAATDALLRELLEPSDGGTRLRGGHSRSSEAGEAPALVGMPLCIAGVQEVHAAWDAGSGDADDAAALAAFAHVQPRPPPRGFPLPLASLAGLARGLGSFWLAPFPFPSPAHRCGDQ